MYLKYVIFVYAISALLISCKDSDNSTSKESIVSENTTAFSPKSENSSSDFSYVASFVGQGAKQSGLLDIPVFKKRLVDLLQSEYNDMVAEWNDDITIQKEEEFYYFSGCDIDDCKKDYYFIVLDNTDNNINIHNFQYSRVKSYEEGAIIGFTEKISTQFDKIRQSQMELN